MTLILTALSEDTIWQVSDRRLTRAGKLYDDAAVKAIVVRCSDAVFVMGYTGVALTQGDWGERLDVWAAKVVSEWPLGTFTGLEVLERFRSELTKLVAAMGRITRIDRRLTWAIAGFGPPGPFLAHISNHEDTRGNELPELVDEFQLVMLLRNETPVQKLNLAFIGATSAVNNVLRSAIQKARKRLHRRRSKPILDALVQIVRKAADDPTSGNLIGKDCLGTIISRTGAAVCFDCAATGKGVVTSPHQVGPGLSVIGLTLEAQTPNKFLMKGRFKFGGGLAEEHLETGSINPPMTQKDLAETLRSMLSNGDYRQLTLATEQDLEGFEPGSVICHVIAERWVTLHRQHEIVRGFLVMNDWLFHKHSVIDTGLPELLDVTPRLDKESEGFLRFIVFDGGSRAIFDSLPHQVQWLSS